MLKLSYKPHLVQGLGLPRSSAAALSCKCTPVLRAGPHFALGLREWGSTTQALRQGSRALWACWALGELGRVSRIAAGWWTSEKPSSPASVNRHSWVPPRPVTSLRNAGDCLQLCPEKARRLVHQASCSLAVPPSPCKTGFYWVEVQHLQCLVQGLTTKAWPLASSSMEVNAEWTRPHGGEDNGWDKVAGNSPPPKMRPRALHSPHPRGGGCLELHPPGRPPAPQLPSAPCFEWSSSFSSAPPCPPPYPCSSYVCSSSLQPFLPPGVKKEGS
jgi:hypothetical protein